jgi:prepilin-type N-terminal cleavage/methylation domain-containing protein
MKLTKKKAGFTLIELLVVISIISLLSSVVISNIDEAKKKGRDARRRIDLEQIRTAMVLYYDKMGNWIENGSGCGWQSNGQGWFNYSGGNYGASIASCLVAAGALPAEIKDPTGGVMSTYPPYFAYMKYHCNAPGGGKKVSILAKMETLPQDTNSTNLSCCPSCDSLYGMNYYVEVF